MPSLDEVIQTVKHWNVLEENGDYLFVQVNALTYFYFQERGENDRRRNTLQEEEAGTVAGMARVLVDASSYTWHRLGMSTKETGAAILHIATPLNIHP